MILQCDGKKAQVFAKTSGRVILGDRKLPAVGPRMAIRFKPPGIVERGQNGWLMRQPIRMNGRNICMSLGSQ